MDAFSKYRIGWSCLRRKRRGYGSGLEAEATTLTSSFRGGERSECGLESGEKLRQGQEVDTVKMTLTGGEEEDGTVPGRGGKFNQEFGFSVWRQHVCLLQCGSCGAQG